MDLAGEAICSAVRCRGEVSRISATLTRWTVGRMPRCSRICRARTVASGVAGAGVDMGRNYTSAAAAG